MNGRVGRTDRDDDSRLLETFQLQCQTKSSQSSPRSAQQADGLLQQVDHLGHGPAPGVELRVAIQVVRRRLGNEFREPAESELSAGVTSPPVSGVRGLPLTPDDFLR